MTYKSILVHLDAGERVQTRLDTALHLARRFGAHLDGVFSVFTPEARGFYMMAGTASWFEEHRRERVQRRAAAERLYAAELTRADIKGNWLQPDGDPNFVVPHYARYADLVVAGQTDSEDPNSYIADSFVENLVLSAGRPVLLLPKHGEFPTLGKRVLIAWDGSREATRALYDAIPFAARAEKTTILTVSEPGKPTEMRQPGADIALTLARHNAMVNVENATGDAIGNVLLSRVHEGGYDLIVMGAYGHARWRELVMGGTSRTVLQSMTVPVLMSH